MGNPAAGILVLLLALWLLLAYFTGRLEWLFSLNRLPAASAAAATGGAPARPTTTGRP